MGTGKVVQLKLETMAHGGEALGRYEGKVVFVPQVVPGEVVRARIVEDRKRWARATLVDVVKLSPQRADPPCPFYGACGGCQWQHIAYEAQLAYKRQVVAEQLQRVGHLERPVVRQTVGMPEPWFYRNHTQFATSESGELGFRAAHSHEVVPVDECILLHPLLDELHAALDVEWPELERVSLRAGIRTGERMIILEIEGDQAPELEAGLPVSCVLRTQDGIDYTLIGSGFYHEVLRGRAYRVSASSFFQVNTEATDVLLESVESYLDPQPDDVLLDAYCGVGTIGLSLLDAVGRVIGIEEHAAAVADARANAEDADHVTVLEGQAETLLPGLGERISKVVLDPPRQGCRPGVLHALAHLRPERIVYVSCDPVTLARDAVSLGESGYGLVEAVPIDVFPQTYHVETVSLWQPV
jgi:23S rRNA (uracil1939-C5)-methyltransferase